MTGIVEYRTKKSLKEAIDADPLKVHIIDPTPWGDINGRIDAHLKAVGDSITVTNHPKRSWFARITRTGDNTYKVE